MPMVDLAFRIAAWAAWQPGAEGTWHSGPSSGVSTAAALASDVPVVLRRRVGELGRNALRAAWGMANTGDARFVFTSRHGEFDRTMEILRALSARQLPSPAAFSLSVHNALAGLLSVASKNRCGHTAIGAGVDSFCYGLLEAACRLVEAPDEPVVLVSYDAPLPPPYDELSVIPSETALVLALLLGAARPDAEPAVALSLEAADGAEPEEMPAKRFLNFVMSDAGDGDYVSRHVRWRWRHVELH